MPDEPTTEPTTEGTPAVTEPTGAAQTPDAAALLVAAERKVAVLSAGLALDSEAGKLALENPGLDIARLVALTTPAAPATPNAAQVAALQAAQLATAGDAAAAAATAARQLVTSGAVGDPTVPDVHPMDLAKQAIADGINKQHLSVQQAMALGVAQIMNGAARGDQRVNYGGRVAPGA